MRTGYICECPVCGDGLVRFWLYRDEVVGLCDECELVWNDVRALADEPSTTGATGSFPDGPDGGGSEEDWQAARHRDVERAGLDGVIAGYSQ